MQKIKAQVVADSVSTGGHRAVSFLCTYPRFIHSEVMTHRMFSRNSASSRAIPFKKMVKMVEEDPFIPIAWQKDHKGMQGTDYFTETDKARVVDGHYTDSLSELKRNWLKGRDEAVKQAKRLNSLGLTKQLCNRLLEPFMWHTILITTTEFENFFEQRCPKYYFEPSNTYFRSRKDFVKEYNDTFQVGIDILTEMKVDDLPIEEWHTKFNHSDAEIHIQALAEAMWDATNESTPRVLTPGMWHFPFHDNMPFNVTWEKAIKIATARCARLSYMTFNKEINYENDIELHDRLLKSKHMSPFEHCLRAMDEDEYVTFMRRVAYSFDEGELQRFAKESEGWCDNFQGWIPYRFLVEERVKI